MITATKRQLIAHAAAEYLTEPLPDDWDVMEDKEAFKWLEDNAWQPFEGRSGSWLWEGINNAARSLQAFLLHLGVEVIATPTVETIQTKVRVQDLSEDKEFYTKETGSFEATPSPHAEGIDNEATEFLKREEDAPNA